MFRRPEPLSIWSVSDGVDMTDIASIVGMPGKLQWSNRGRGRLRDGYGTGRPMPGKARVIYMSGAIYRIYPLLAGVASASCSFRSSARRNKYSGGIWETTS